MHSAEVVHLDPITLDKEVIIVSFSKVPTDEKVTYSGRDASLAYVLCSRIAVATAVQIRNYKLAVRVLLRQLTLVVTKALVSKFRR